MNWKPHIFGSKKLLRHAIQKWSSKCEGISCSSFSVKELDVIVHKKYFPCITLLNFGHSVPHLTSKPGG